MRIEEVKINGFGNIKNKEIKFEDGINLVVGDNESGKSMLMAYIKAIFFGIYKSRKRDVIQEKDKYTPWMGDDFSGTLTYILDSGERYTIFRDFERGKIKILNENGQDITIKYRLDKETGSKFLEDQVGIDKQAFMFSTYSMQNSVVLSSEDKLQMVQKLSNLATTGEENVSYNRLKEKITLKRKEEVGTSKTTTMPINLVNNKITSIKNEIKRMREKNLENMGATENERKIRGKFNEVECKRKLIEDLKTEKIKQQAGDHILKDMRQKILEKREEINKKQDVKHDILEKHSAFVHNKIKNIVLLLVMIVLEALVVFFKPNLLKKQDIVSDVAIYGIVPFVSVILFFIMHFHTKTKIEKDFSKKSEENRDLEKEINIIRKDIMAQEKDLDKQKREIESKEKLFRTMLIAEYCGTINDKYLDKIMKYNLDELRQEEKNIDEEYTNIIQELSTIDAKRVIANKELEKKAFMEEELEGLEKEKQEFEDLNGAYEIVLQGLEQAYNEMKKSISPSFVNKISKFTNIITDGKYKSVVLDGEQRVKVKTEKGDYIDLEKLSVGTIEQINLGLRLSILSEITPENMPLFLDESFVYYDKKRMNKILEVLYKDLKRQVILFSCTDREKKLLDESNVIYNLIDMNIINS